MTLKPFKIISIKGNTEYGIYDHRGNKVCLSQRLHKQFYKKLLSYPITAFGYELGIYVSDKFKRINPKFDKKDVIKALDFWIEYFVYQNKCDYILENTVNSEFELHLKELIMVREAVLKDPADTKYVRQKIRVKNTSIGIDPGGKDFGMTSITTVNTNKDNMIEFTENVLDINQKGNSSFSTVDQFCYKVKTMTRKEYEEYNKPKLYSKDLAQVVISVGNLSRIIAALLDVQGRMSWEEAINQIPVPADIQRAATFENPDIGVMINSSSSALAGKRISRIDVRRRKPFEPSG